MFIPDLASYGLGGRFDPVMAVGWLDAPHRFSTGPFDRRAFERLFRLRQRPLCQPRRHLWGYHSCTLCPYAAWWVVCKVRWRAGGIRGLWKTDVVVVGQGEFFVPGRGCVYVAPTMILHYMLAHAYRPPEPFLEAVLAAPRDAVAYTGALIANGAADYVVADGTSGADPRDAGLWGLPPVGGGHGTPVDRPIKPQGG